MSFNAIQWALSCELKTTPKMVLIAMADHVNSSRPDELIYPSIDRLAGMAGCSRRSVIDAIKVLLKSGLVEAKKTNGTVTKYSLKMEITSAESAPVEPVNTSAENDQTSADIAPVNGFCTGAESAQTSAESAPTSAKSVKTSADSAPEQGRTSKEQGRTRKRSSSPKFDFSSWPAPPSEQVLADWITVRKSKKAPLTQTAVDRMANELKKAVDFGLTVDDCLAECCESNWIRFKLEWHQNRIQQSQTVQRGENSGTSKQSGGQSNEVDEFLRQQYAGLQ